MSDQNDKNISYFEARNDGIFFRIIRHLTKFAWRRIVHAPINRMYERSLIDSTVFHEAHDYAARLIDCQKP